MDFLYETHMHTAEVSGCAISSAEQQVITYKKRGYAGIIITDHFINGYTRCPKDLTWEEKMRFMVSGYEAAKIAGKTHGLDVFLGWEFSANGADFLTYGLDFDFLLGFNGLDELNIEEYSKIVRKSGGYLAQAHPYREEYYIENPFPVAPHLIDGVEVFNAMDRKEVNAKAFKFAQENDLPMQAGTDSHGRGYRFFKGIALKERAKSIFDIINAIKKREVRLF